MTNSQEMINNEENCNCDTTHIIKIQDSAKGIRLSVLATCSQTRQKPKKEEIPISTNEND
jgi:hypothetical protein